MSLAGKPAPESRAIHEGTRVCSPATRSMLQLSVVALTLASGCTLVSDTDRHQCKAPADCVKILGGEPSAYTCEENLCRTVVQCINNDQCTTAGRNVCSEGTCVECVIDSDCDSPTATCVANVCDDPTWGCLNKADSRPAATQSSVTFTMKTLNALTQQPLQNLTVQACRDVVVDPNCLANYTSAVPSYDLSSGNVRVTGLQTGVPVHLKLNVPADTGLLSINYLSNRPGRDMEVGEELLMAPSAIVSSLPAPNMIPIDIKKGVFTVRIYNCMGSPAEGVTVSMSDPPADLVTAYIEGVAPRFDLTSTTKSGRAGLLNVKTGVLTTISARISPSKVISFQMVPVGERATWVDLFPGIFTGN